MVNKKKRGHPEAEEILARPWCYYCERDFDDLKILINHHKAKHFKCERCGRRLNTAGGLSVHMTQVHKETLTTIENALPNRSNLDVEIFGMEGIPDDVMTSHNQRVLSQFAQAEAERRAATGNPGPGGAGGGGVKKPKFEAPSDLKKRLAEHKAKKAAEQAAGVSSGDATPVGAGRDGQSPALGQSPGGFAGSPTYPPQQMPYGGAPNSTYSSFPQSYGQPPTPYQQQPPAYQQQSPIFQTPGMPQYPNNQPFASPQQFPPPGGQAFPPQFQHGPPRPYGAGSPPLPFQQGQYQPPRTHTPPQLPPNASLPLRPTGLPPAPGLPQRPSFGAPPVNAFQMQQMHQGQLPGPPNPASFAQQGSPQHPINGFNNIQHASNGPPRHDSGGQSTKSPVNDRQEQASANATSLDDLLSGAAKDADEAGIAAEAKANIRAENAQPEKKNKKDKEKATKLVYSDNETSPEEKMAQLPRYAFVPDGKGETVLGDATTAAVTGVARGSNDVLDMQG